MDYQEFIRSKKTRTKRYGFIVDQDQLNPKAWEWQRRVTAWAIERGRSAMFLETGLGKTICQLMWAEQVVNHTGLPVLIHCPVGVRRQTWGEAERFGIQVPVDVADELVDEDPRIVIANYEKLHRFDTTMFGGVVLDESSILKGLTGKIREQLTEAWAFAQFRLACTATPSPNDTKELGNHAEFLGVCSHQEMLAKFFVNDAGDTKQWRLKGHAVNAFWDWVCEWAVCATLPSDVGGDDTGYILPELIETTHNVHVPSVPSKGCLFDTTGISATNIHDEKRKTSPYRAKHTADIVNAEPDRAWVIWCDTNYESDDLVKHMPQAVEIRGDMSEEKKESILAGFADGSIKVLISKPSITGSGLNWQHCQRTVFHSISYSFEQRYQAIRRFYRFGQKESVHVHYVTCDTEHAIANAVEQKFDKHINMQEQMRQAMRRSELAMTYDSGRKTYSTSRSMEIPQWLK